MTTSATSEEPWHAAYPSPISKPDIITRAETLHLLETATPGKDFILVDVRRTDFEGGTIRHSINLPAQSLYPTLPAVYTLCSSVPVSKLIFYCGSSHGRGPRAAGWLQDFIDARGNTSMRALVLEGGIKGWVEAGGEYVEMIVS